MAKSSRGRRRIASQRPSPYPSPSSQQMTSTFPKHSHKKNEWEDLTCSVCMESPHNAVLLLCSSHDNGCRPYMCGTGFRFSNCYDQYKSSSSYSAKPGSAVGSVNAWSDSPDLDPPELPCPLCRGRVKGLTVVEGARAYFNSKERGCMEEKCGFAGDYREMRKHVRVEHPHARPRDVDPTLDQRWRRFEREREREDAISTITSSIPGATVFGDYVIEGPGDYTDGEEGEEAEEEGDGDFDPVFGDHLLNVVLFLHGFSGGTNARRRRVERRFRNVPEERENEEGGNVVEAAVRVVNNRHRLGRVRFRDRLRDGGRDGNG